MVPIVVLVFVVLYIVPVPVCLMAVAITIAVASYLPAAVPAVIAVVIVSPAVVSVVVIPDAIAEARVVAETWIVSQACLVHSPPFPIFPLALTVEPVVFDVLITPLGQPLAVSIIVIGVAVVRAASVIGTRTVPVLSASGKCQ
jgi:hypothetical protein